MRYSQNVHSYSLCCPGTTAAANVLTKQKRKFLWFIDNKNLTTLPNCNIRNQLAENNYDNLQARPQQNSGLLISPEEGRTLLTAQEEGFSSITNKIKESINKLQQTCFNQIN